MSSALHPIEVRCDAPPYAIVQACRRLGCRSPEDVLWLRVRNFVAPKGEERGFLAALWRALWRWNIPPQRACKCGDAFPRLRSVTFTFDTGMERRLLIGQCARCRTIFWEENER